jgi:hypothetical protein
MKYSGSSALLLGISAITLAFAKFCFFAGNRLPSHLRAGN